MQLNDATILGRLSAVENTAGSITALGSWWCLHAFSGAAIANAWAALITHAKTDSQRRTALLMSCHEVVLSCLQLRASLDKAVLSLIRPIARLFPDALSKSVEVAERQQAAAASDVEDVKAFVASVEQVMHWWTSAKVFPPDVTGRVLSATAEYHKRHDAKATSAPPAPAPSTATSAIDGNVVAPVKRFLVAYNKFVAAKERYQAAQVRTTDGGEDSADAKDALTRRLLRLRKVITGRDEDAADANDDSESETTPGDDSLSAFVDAELLALGHKSETTNDASAPPVTAAFSDPLSGLFD